MAYRGLCVLSIVLTMAAACSEESNPPIFTGTGGTGGAGVGGIGGDFVIPEPQRDCAVNPICQVCPSERLCDSNADCGVGFTCIESGCTDLDDGSVIRQCVFSGGGACNDDSNCSEGRECVEVEEEGLRCIKTTLGARRRATASRASNVKKARASTGGFRASTTATVPRTTSATAKPDRCFARAFRSTASRTSSASAARASAPTSTMTARKSALDRSSSTRRRVPAPTTSAETPARRSARRRA